MVKTYSDKAQQLEQAELSDAFLLSVGRLVRAFAEIEDILTLHICKLLGTTESKGIIVLGRTGFNKKVEIAQFLGKLTGAETVKIHQSIFDDAFKDASAARNAVAHGSLVGKTADGFYTFRTVDATGHDGASATLKTLGLREGDVANYATMAGLIITSCKSKLLLASSPDKRHELLLQPHHKPQGHNKP